MIGWVFFRSESLNYAINYLGSMFGFLDGSNPKYSVFFYLDPKILLTLLIAIILTTPIAIWTSKLIQAKIYRPQFTYLKPIVYASYYLLLTSLFAISTASLAAGTYNPFIYYRF
jgi:alginate O-acetyltransferase complex protein AlgI